MSQLCRIPSALQHISQGNIGMKLHTLLRIEGSLVSHPLLVAPVAAQLYETLYSIAQLVEGDVKLEEHEQLVWKMTYGKQENITVLLGEVSLTDGLGLRPLSTVGNIRIARDRVQVGSGAADGPSNVYRNIAKILKAT